MRNTFSIKKIQGHNEHKGDTTATKDIRLGDLCALFVAFVTLRSMRRRSNFFLQPGLLTLFVVYACGDKAPQTKPVREDISESVYALGVVKSKNQYQAFSTVSGIVKKLLVEEGDSVGIGTPLMRISDQPSRLATQNAKLAADYAAIRSNQERLDELRLRIELAKDKLSNDSLLLARTRAMWRENVGTKIDLEQKELNYQTSAAAYRIARLEFNTLRRQLNFMAAQSRTTLSINSTLQDEYTVKSEVNGKVYSLLKEEGELVNSQSPVAILGDGTSFYLELQVDEYDVAKMVPGQKVLITMDSYRGSVFTATIVRVHPIMSEKSKSFTVDADFITPPPVLYPFLTAEANIIIKTKKNALTIPRSCLSDDGMVTLESGRKVKVVTGLRDYERVEIIDGLKDDQVILIQSK